MELSVYFAMYGHVYLPHIAYLASHKSLRKLHIHVTRYIHFNFCFHSCPLYYHLKIINRGAKLNAIALDQLSSSTLPELSCIPLLQIRTNGEHALNISFLILTFSQQNHNGRVREDVLIRRHVLGAPLLIRLVLEVIVEQDMRKHELNHGRRKEAAGARIPPGAKMQLRAIDGRKLEAVLVLRVVRLTLKAKAIKILGSAARNDAVVHVDGLGRQADVRASGEVGSVCKVKRFGEIPVE